MSTVVLFMPAASSKARYGRLRRVLGRGTIRPHLGLLSLGGVLKRAGHTVHLVDGMALGLDADQAASQVLSLSPDIVACTAYSLSIGEAAAVAARIKRASGRALTVIGGPHLTAVPEQTLTRYDSFDIGVAGEGEQTLLELAAWHGEADLRHIDGLVLRNQDRVEMTPPRALIDDLDGLPFPAWDLLAGYPDNYPLHRSRYRRIPVADVCTSRGCPYQCTFCDKAVFGSRFRGFSAAYVTDLVLWLHRRLGVAEIMFKDDLIMQDRDRFRQICEGLLESGAPLTWSCMGRADLVDAELLRLMKRAGCWQISYGIESGSQPLLDRANKRLDLRQVEHAVHMTRRAGLSARGFFVLGLPGETRSTIRESIALAKRIPLDDINVALCTPFPGSRLYAEASRHGEFDADWSAMNKLSAVFVPNGLTRNELERSLVRFFAEFYGRPRVLWNLGRRLASRPRERQQP
jgi:radical SAM superfamily enzyme YgiQ (UPF0313 family)